MGKKRDYSFRGAGPAGGVGDPAAGGTDGSAFLLKYLRAK